VLAALFNNLAFQANTLLSLAVGLLMIYLILFFALLARHPKDRAILAADRKAKRSNLLLVPLVVAAVIAQVPYNVAALFVLVPLLLAFSWTQHKRLMLAGASRVFLRQLALVSSLGFLGMLAFVAVSLVHSAAGG
jgi:hypothetical protein